MGYELGLTATVTNSSKRTGSYRLPTLLLGFVAAWSRYFGPKEASVVNRMVLVQFTQPIPERLPGPTRNHG